MTGMPALETERLLIRPFALADLDRIHQILDVELADVDVGTDGVLRDERAVWLRWTILSYDQLAHLNQPPYSDRAVVLKASAEVIGACGYVPSLNFFEQLPSFTDESYPPDQSLTSPEVGLYYAIAPAFQRQGLATEAAQALIDYAFDELALKRIVALTSHDNAASMGVMRRLGMHVECNPYAEPPWLQVAGLLENPKRA